MKRESGQTEGKKGEKVNYGSIMEQNLREGNSNMGAKVIERRVATSG